MQRPAAHDTALSERHYRSRGATTLDSTPAAGASQHVATPHVVPAHQVGLDGVFPQQHRHRIVDMGGRNVSVRVHALQSLNQSLFDCVDHMVSIDTVGFLCKAGETPGVGSSPWTERRLAPAVVPDGSDATLMVSAECDHART
jgi:hypothetical protein